MISIHAPTKGTTRPYSVLAAALRTASYNLQAVSPKDSPKTIARNQASQAKNKGLFAQQELFAFVNCEAHYSFDRAANVLGLGSDHLIKIPVDEHGRMRTDALEAELARVRA